MNPEVMLILSKVIFGGSILLIIYLVYREFLIKRMDAERDEIALGEKINEDNVGHLTDQQLADLVNKQSSEPIPDSPYKKK